MYVQTVLRVEVCAFFSVINWIIFCKNCPQFGKDIIKIKGVVFYETPCSIAVFVFLSWWWSSLHSVSNMSPWRHRKTLMHKLLDFISYFFKIDIRALAVLCLCCISVKIYIMLMSIVSFNTFIFFVTDCSWQSGHMNPGSKISNQPSVNPAEVMKVLIKDTEDVDTSASGKHWFTFVF